MDIEEILHEIEIMLDTSTDTLSKTSDNEKEDIAHLEGYISGIGEIYKLLDNLES